MEFFKNILATLTAPFKAVVATIKESYETLLSKVLSSAAFSLYKASTGTTTTRNIFLAGVAGISVVVAVLSSVTFAVGFAAFLLALEETAHVLTCVAIGALYDVNIEK